MRVRQHSRRFFPLSAQSAPEADIVPAPFLTNISLKRVRISGWIKKSCEKNANGKLKHTSLSQFARSVVNKYSGIKRYPYHGPALRPAENIAAGGNSVG